MNQVAIQSNESLELSSSFLPIVIVGNGPVGMRVAQELIDRKPDVFIIIYGKEEVEPYNRVKLSSWLAGEIGQEQLYDNLNLSDNSNVEFRSGIKVTQIIRDRKLIFDDAGNSQSYKKLILATGSSAFIPEINGIHKNGVYTFRDIHDTHLLLECQKNCDHIVVLGGGLLGVEAARSMIRFGAKVTLIEHSDRLLGNQLDETASNFLVDELTKKGIEVKLNQGVSAVLGVRDVEAVLLLSGNVITCNSVVLATGIKPNIQMAKLAKLAFGRGIRTNDFMLTSDKDIYAVGECAEHRGEVYGLVGPGLEQAAVAASHILGIEGEYKGSVVSSRLKVIGHMVFSMGPMGEHAAKSFGKTHVFEDKSTGVYRKILIEKNRIAGAIAYGDWNEIHSIQAAIHSKKWLLPWKVWSFKSTGDIWPELNNVANWPSTETVCQCMNISRGVISDAINSGSNTVVAITQKTCAGSVCGSCKPLIAELIDKDAPLEPVTYAKGLLTTAILSTLLLFLILFIPGFQFSDSVTSKNLFDQLLTETHLKQWTGFSMLGVLSLGLIITPLKRLSFFKKKISKQTNGIASWRFFHAILGLLIIVILISHTGAHWGSGLNRYLMISFYSMMIIGAIATLIYSLEHKIKVVNATQIRSKMLSWHVYVLWPLPVLLGFHILKTYWY